MNFIALFSLIRYILDMELTENIRLCLKKKNLTATKLAELTGQSQSNLANKLKRGYLMTNELEKIADAMGADLEMRFIDRRTGKPIAEPRPEQEARELDSAKLSVTGDVKAIHEFFNRLLQSITFPNGDYTAEASLTVPEGIKVELLSVSETKKESV